MKAVVARGAGELAVEDVEQPAAAAGRVLVGIAYGGICGSDLHYARDGRNGAYEIEEPLVLGHEVVGVVDSVGAGVTGVEPGTSVAIHPATPTPRCPSGSPTSASRPRPRTSSRSPRRRAPPSRSGSHRRRQTSRPPARTRTRR